MHNTQERGALKTVNFIRKQHILKQCSTGTRTAERGTDLQNKVDSLDRNQSIMKNLAYDKVETALYFK